MCPGTPTHVPQLPLDAHAGNQILAVAPQGDAATGADIVYVWDSTDAMPFPPR